MTRSPREKSAGIASRYQVVLRKRNEFCYTLQDWIHHRMQEIESKEGVYSLEGWQEFRVWRSRDYSPYDQPDDAIQSVDGEFTSLDGRTLSADVGMIQKPLDLSRMSLEWVSHNWRQRM